MRPLAAACFTSLLLLSPVVLCAQAPATSSPEEVTRQLIERTRAGDWPGYVRLMHPDALVEFKRMLGEIVVADPSGEVGKQFFGTADAASYVALEPAVLFERFMTNLSEKIPPFAEALKSVTGTVVGSVPDGPDVAHVVFRSAATTEGIAISRVGTASVKRHNGEWRALLNGSIEGIAARIQQLAAQAKAG